MLYTYKLRQYEEIGEIAGELLCSEVTTMSDNILVKDKKYEGQYVALWSLTNKEVVASGDDPSEVIRQARAKGSVAPVIVFIPEADMTLIY